MYPAAGVKLKRAYPAVGIRCSPSAWSKAEGFFPVDVKLKGAYPADGVKLTGIRPAVGAKLKGTYSAVV